MPVVARRTAILLVCVRVMAWRAEMAWRMAVVVNAVVFTSVVPLRRSVAAGMRTWMRRLPVRRVMSTVPSRRLMAVPVYIVMVVMVVVAVVVLVSSAAFVDRAKHVCEPQANPIRLKCKHARHNSCKIVHKLIAAL
jgi:hypothetical protein